MLRNNYLDNATAKQVIKNHLHAFKRAIVNDEIFERMLRILDACKKAASIGSLPSCQSSSFCTRTFAQVGNRRDWGIGAVLEHSSGIPIEN
jgi:hypothetical protein